MDQFLHRVPDLFIGGLIGIAIRPLRKFLASYASEKAKNVATREDFHHLLEQLRKTTEETESIRNELTSYHWLRQQNWSRRERFYLDLLSELTKLRISLEKRRAYYMEPGSEHDSSISEQPHYLKLKEQAHAAFQKIQELVGPAAVFLSEATVEILRRLIMNYWEAAEYSFHHVEFLGAALRDVDRAYVEVLAGAKAELSTTGEI